MLRKCRELLIHLCNGGNIPVNDWRSNPPFKKFKYDAHALEYRINWDI
jgi:hypothetical protein